jgi:hypothetical protein
LFGLPIQKIQNRWISNKNGRNPNKNPGNPNIKSAKSKQYKNRFLVWISQIFERIWEIQT